MHVPFVDRIELSGLRHDASIVCAAPRKFAAGVEGQCAVRNFARGSGDLERAVFYSKIEKSIGKVQRFTEISLDVSRSRVCFRGGEKFARI